VHELRHVTYQLGLPTCKMIGFRHASFEGYGVLILSAEVRVYRSSWRLNWYETLGKRTLCRDADFY
jgi:hypothetical protein